MEDIVYMAIYLAMVINGLLILLEKWDVLNWLRGNIGGKVFDCYFCLSHHLAMLVILPFVINNGQFELLLIPLMVAGLINLTK